MRAEHIKKFFLWLLPVTLVGACSLRPSANVILGKYIRESNDRAYTETLILGHNYRYKQTITNKDGVLSSIEGRFRIFEGSEKHVASIALNINTPNKEIRDTLNYAFVGISENVYLVEYNRSNLNLLLDQTNSKFNRLQRVSESGDF